MGAAGMRAGLVVASSVLFGGPITAHASSAAQQEFASVTRLKANVAHGEQLFDTCAACHGSKGAGTSDGTVPVIAGQHFQVLAWELVSFRHEGRRDPRMEHFTGQHHLSGVQDIADVASYVSHLPPQGSSSHGDGSQLTRGEELYRHNCSSCHGAKAEGDDRKRNPRLAGQHYQYLLLQAQTGTSAGRSTFSRRHVQLLEHIGSADIEAICDYVSRLGP
jgi:cytochrome c553